MYSSFFFFYFRIVFLTVADFTVVLNRHLSWVFFLDTTLL